MQILHYNTFSYDLHNEKHSEMKHSTFTYVKWYPIKIYFKAITLTQFEYSDITRDPYTAVFGNVKIVVLTSG